MADLLSEIEKIVDSDIPPEIAELYEGKIEVDLPAEIDIPSNSQWIDDVECLFDAESALGLLRYDLESVKYEVRSIPANTLPVGDDGHGEFYVASVRESDFGAIYFMFHETADPMDDSLTGAILLAPNFTDWIASFRVPKERIKTPDWDAIRKEQLNAILNPPKKPWWKFW